MAKKEFIRHLEFYGFPDQNVFANWGGVDLSDIIKKNEEQDEEIGELTDEKANKQDLDTLSGTVETVVSAQSIFNNDVVNALSGLNNDIQTLKDVDIEFGNQLSAITDGVNNVIERTDNIETQVSGITDDLAELSGKVETLSGETFSGIAEVQANLIDFGRFVDSHFAEKNEVYTKEEIDEEFAKCATQEWVNEQGFLTESSGDSRYAKLDELNDLSSEIERVDNNVSEVSGKTEVLESSLNSLSGETDSKFAQIRDEIEEAKSNYYTKDEIDVKSAEVDESLNQLNNTKADKTQVDEISAVLDTKVNQTVFEQYFDTLQRTKADKTELEITNANVEALGNRINNEESARISNDNTLSGEIDSNTEKIEIIREENVGRDNRISELEEGLAQEIQDRESGDTSIIGTASDVKENNTIYGAKKYAENEGSKAIATSNAYTDDKAREIYGEMESLSESVDQRLSSAVTKSYVDGKVNDVKEDLTSEIETQIQAESNRAKMVEASLNTYVGIISGATSANQNEIIATNNKVNAITTWDGTSPYVSGGTGVLDVLHDEFHALIQTLIDKGILP